MSHRSSAVLAIAVIAARRVRPVGADRVRRGSRSRCSSRSRPPDPTSKHKDDAPSIEATIVGGADRAAGQVHADRRPARSRRRRSRRASCGRTRRAPRRSRSRSCSTARRSGSATTTTSPRTSPARYLGILKNLKTALQTVPFATAGPAGQQGHADLVRRQAGDQGPDGPARRTSPPRRSARSRTTTGRSAPRWSRASRSRSPSCTTSPRRARR